MHVISKGILAGWMSLLLAAPALAQEPEKKDEKAELKAKAKAETDADAEEEEEDGKKWSVGARVSSSVGQGTFVNVANDNPYYDPSCTDPIVQGCVGDARSAYDRASLSFGVNAGYRLDDFNFGTSISARKSLTRGGSTQRPRDMRIGDLGLSAGYKGYTFESIGVSISPGISASLPTSLSSQFATRVLGTNLSVGISRTFLDRLNLSLGVGVGKDFHRSTIPGFNEAKWDEEDEFEFLDGNRPESIVYRSGENVRGIVFVDGVNTEWSLSTSLSASFALYKKLSFAASYNFGTYWTYAVSREDHPLYGDVDPEIEGFNDGRGVGQSVSTSVGLSYPIELGDFGLNLSAGIGTGTAPKTDDNRSFKFPFWNFSGAAANGSALRFGISANY